jgi:hypothetical protein
MTNSRFSRDTKFSASSKNEIIKRESERFKKMIKNKTFINLRSFRRDLEDVETTSIFFRFVVDSKSFIISAFFYRVHVDVFYYYCVDVFCYSCVHFFRYAFFCFCVFWRIDSELNIRKNESKCFDSFIDDINFFARWIIECFHRWYCCKFVFDSNFNFYDRICCHHRRKIDDTKWIFRFWWVFC